MHNTNIPCGCLIEYEGDQTHQDYSIDWCPLHKAASELLEALISVIDSYDHNMSNATKSQRRAWGREAITKAT